MKVLHLGTCDAGLYPIAKAKLRYLRLIAFWYLRLIAFCPGTRNPQPETRTPESETRKWGGAKNDVRNAKSA